MKLQTFLDVLSALQRRHALLLFLALGGLLFAVDGLRSRPQSLPGLPAGLESPQAANQWLEDEVLYREAVARGLGEGDLIIRRRLVQKMRLLLEVGADVAEPSEAQLRDWIAAHAGRYGGVARLSFDHLFLSRGRHDARLGADATAMAETLRQQPDADLAALSDPHPGGTHIEALSAVELDRQFGKALAPQLGELPVGSWQGPLASSLGLHFVRIRERHLQTPDYPAVRERAQRDWLLDQRELQTQRALDRLKARYGIAMGGKP
ncbi:MAG: peptidylprolyl isomerase [Stagnimonas sp.]|nr:peptidylprolyl isomerase [Stagnimonas sp.]